MNKKCVIFDIDGTLADNTHRLHYLKGPYKSWDLYDSELSKDTLIVSVMKTLNVLGVIFPIIFLTGRSVKTKKTTMQWLKDNGMPYEFIKSTNTLKKQSTLLLMRSINDNRENYIYKKNQVENLIKHNIEPILAFDDDIKCRKMFLSFNIDTIDPAILK